MFMLNISPFSSQPEPAPRTMAGSLAALWRASRGALTGAMLLLTSMPFAAVHAADAPRDVVAAMQDALLSVWEQSEALSPQQRYQRLEPALQQAFDFQRMIEVATGPAWTRATPAEQEQLKQAFTRYSVATYASRFSEYTGQKFDIVDQRTGPRGLTLVDTIIVRPAGESVPITYVVTTESNPPRIVDVIHKGVSEMAVRRSDYRSIVTSSGPQVLAQRLEQQAEDLLKQ